MKISLEELIRFLDNAIEEEKKGEKLFKDLAEKVTDPLAKRLFETLAEDEVRHLKFLIEEKENLIKKGEWKEENEEIEIKLFKLPKIDIFKDLSPKKVESNLDDIKALELAVEIEDNIHNFYYDLAEKIDDPLGKELILKLAKAEEAHYLILQSELDYINRVGFWFDIREFTMEH